MPTSDLDLAVRADLDKVDPATLRRYLAGEITLRFVEKNPLELDLAGLSLEAAHKHLKGKKEPALAKYWSVVRADAPPAGKSAWIDQILKDVYGVTYQPAPEQARPARKSAQGAPKPRSAAPTKRASSSSKSTLSVAEVIEHLREVESTAVAMALLELGRLKGPYHQIADAFNMEYTSGDTVQQLKEAIVARAMRPARARVLQQGGLD
jgi:hypothetical protein